LDLISSLPYTGFLLIAGVAVSIAVAYLVYFFRYNKREFTTLQRYSLAILRSLSLFIVAFLLLGLLLQLSRKYYEKPVLAIAIDNSESVKVGYPSISEEMDIFLTNAKQELSDRFTIQVIQFGESYQTHSDMGFTDKVSDYNLFFENIISQFYNLNLGAVVLVGDGIVNKGKSPLLKANNLNAPLYTLGTGDTTVVADQAIIEVIHNPSVFIGNDFSFQVDYNFRNFQADSAHVEIFMGDRMLVSEKINVLQRSYFVSKKYTITAEKAGLQKIQIRLVPSVEERNLQNNRYQFTIEVHERKQKVLLISQGPHPDLGTLAESLKEQANFEVTSTFLHLFSGDLNSYDLVVLNQLPSLAQQQADFYEQIKESKVAVLVIVGPSTSIAALNNLNLPFSLEPSVKFEESMPYFNPAFSQFTIPSELLALESELPPLLTYFSKYKLDSKLNILAYQKINNLIMDYPLMAFGEVERRKVGVIFGEGIWRWRMREFQQLESNKATSSAFVNMLTYLALKEDQDQFKVRYKPIVDEISPVVFKARLLDEIFEPVLDAEVSLVLTDSSGAELNYLFDHSDLDYELTLGYLPAGDYQFLASTSLGDQEFQQVGKFTVQPVQLENQNLTADFGLLKELSVLTGGEFFTFNNSGRLIEALKQKPGVEKKEHSETSIREFIEWKWVFIILILLLSLEWFLRKFWGSY